MSLQHVTLELRREQVDECVAFYELLSFHRVEPPHRQPVLVTSP